MFLKGAVHKMKLANRSVEMVEFPNDNLLRKISLIVLVQGLFKWNHILKKIPSMTHEGLMIIVKVSHDSVEHLYFFIVIV